VQIAAGSFSPSASAGDPKPTVEAMLSYDDRKMGQGWVYAVTRLDETGATIGPLLMG